MFKRILNRFVSRSRETRQAGRGRQTMNRKGTVELLESREFFAADTFVGVYNSGVWTLDGQTAQISFGLPGDQPVMGDWNGDGKKTPGVFRNGMWVLDETGNGFDSGDRVLYFGLSGDKAIAGDWNGDGKDTVGIFRNGNFTFDKNGNGFDAADTEVISFGWATDIPVAGDWNGDGKDTVGVYRSGTWVLDLTGNGFDGGDRVLQFGLPKDQPVVGDWNGDGKDTPGVLQNGQWFFDREGNGYTGETGTPNRLGSGIAVSGQRSRSNSPTTSQTLNPSNAPLKTQQQLSTDPDDTTTKAIDLGTVTRIASSSGVISTATDVDMFKVYLRKGTAGFDIDTKENGTGGLGSYIRIFDVNGRNLGANNDGQAPDETPIPRNRDADREYFDSYLSLKIPADGWYYIGVSNWQNSSYDPKTGAKDTTGKRHLTGAYQLNVTSEPTNTILVIANSNATLNGQRGSIQGNTLVSSASDFRSQDQIASMGKLTAAQTAQHTNYLTAFLNGQTPGNSLAGSPNANDRTSIIAPILTRFLNGTGGTLSHDSGSSLSNRVKSSGNFQYALLKLSESVQSQLQLQMNRGRLDFAATSLSSYISGATSRIFFQPQDILTPFVLRAVVGGTQGLRVSIQFQKVSTSIGSAGGGTVAYEAKVKFEIFDVFGAGSGDRYTAALESMWQLQHRGSAKPFVNRIVIEETIKGNLSVPKQFNSTIVV